MNAVQYNGMYISLGTSDSNPATALLVGSLVASGTLRLTEPVRIDGATRTLGAAETYGWRLAA